MIKALDVTTIITTTCKLKKGSIELLVVVSYDPAIFKVTLTPNAPLEYNTQYTVVFTTGIKDVAGNALATEQSWNFTTMAAPILGDSWRIDFPSNPDNIWNHSDSASLLIGWGFMNIQTPEVPPSPGVYATLIGQDGSVYRIKQLKTGLWMVVI